MRPKVIAVVGPTASGKTSLGIYLAQKLGGEVISADSRQVYRGLDIGTGKVTKEEMAGVPHHLLDVASPKKQYSVSDFLKDSTKALYDIMIYHKVPMVVGGTGLYVDSLFGRMIFPDVPPNEKLREKLEKKSTEQLFVMLEKKDPRRAATIEKGNKRRLIRALEIAEALGASPVGGPALKGTGTFDVLWLGIALPPEKLQQNIHARLLSRIIDGMVEEAITLHKKGLSYKRMEELGLEYRFLSQLLQHKISKEQFVAELQRAINKYAKRQMRWFKRNKDIHWVSNKTEALRLAREFLS
jgi:tRNA dimethylallyltransferase